MKILKVDLRKVKLSKIFNQKLFKVFNRHLSVAIEVDCLDVLINIGLGGVVVLADGFVDVTDHRTDLVVLDVAAKVLVVQLEHPPGQTPGVLGVCETALTGVGNHVGALEEGLPDV